MKLSYTDMHVIDCHDLSDFATEVFGRQFNALHARARVFDGASQDSYESFDTTQEPWEEDAPTVEDWLNFDLSVVETMSFDYDFQRQTWIENNEPAIDPETVVRWLVRHGYAPEGEYLIRYWW